MVDEIKLRKDIYTAFCDSCTYATNLCCDNSCKIHQVIRIIDMQSHLSIDAELDKGWISVKNRLPENDGLYIVCKTINGHQIIFEAHWKGNKWLSVVKNNQLDYVTHWQPLPEPPKEVCDWVDDNSLPNEDMRPDNEAI